MKVYKLVCRFKRKYPMTIANFLKRHSKVAASIVDKDESVVYAFCGQKNDTNGMIFDTCVVVVTDRRLIIGQKRLLWGYQISTITRDLFNDLKISSGLIWGRVEIDTVKEVTYISNLDKKSLDEIETYINRVMIQKEVKPEDVKEGE
jgi:hypothetical protein